MSWRVITCWIQTLRSRRLRFSYLQLFIFVGWINLHYVNRSNIEESQAPSRNAMDVGTITVKEELPCVHEKKILRAFGVLEKWAREWKRWQRKLFLDGIFAVGVFVFGSKSWVMYYGTALMITGPLNGRYGRVWTCITQGLGPQNSFSYSASFEGSGYHWVKYLPKT